MAKTATQQKKSLKKVASNVAKLDAENPIPLGGNSFSYSYAQKHRYLPFLGDNNNFAKILLETRMLSPTSDACIRRKKNYCAGVGFRHIEQKELPEQFSLWAKSINRKNNSLNRVNQQLFESHFTFGNTPIEIIRFEFRGKKFFQVEVHNTLEWRLGPPNKFGLITYAVQSPLFKNSGFTITQESRRLPLYNPLNSERENWEKDENGVERTMIWYKNEIMGVDHYGLPSYIGALINAQLEYKGSRYNLDNFDNNMVVASILALRGNVSDEEAKKIAKDIVKTHTGDGKRGRTLVVSSEEGIEGTDLHQMETHKDASYLDADDRWTQKIVMAHDWDSTLIGLQLASALGKGSGYLTKILEHILNTTIEPAQQDAYDEVWSHILHLGNEWMNWGIDPNELEYANKIDISGLTDIDITTAVQVNEVRRAKGLPEDPAMNGIYMEKGKKKPAHEND